MVNRSLISVKIIYCVILPLNKNSNIYFVGSEKVRLLVLFFRIHEVFSIEIIGLGFKLTEFSNKIVTSAYKLSFLEARV